MVRVAGPAFREKWMDLVNSDSHQVIGPQWLHQGCSAHPFLHANVPRGLQDPCAQLLSHLNLFSSLAKLSTLWEQLGLGSAHPSHGFVQPWGILPLQLSTPRRMSALNCSCGCLRESPTHLPCLLLPLTSAKLFTSIQQYPTFSWEVRWEVSGPFWPFPTICLICQQILLFLPPPIVSTITVLPCLISQLLLQPP